jgi:hypothetical protein
MTVSLILKNFRKEKKGLSDIMESPFVYGIETTYIVVFQGIVYMNLANYINY